MNTMTHQQDKEELRSPFPYRLHALLSNIERAGPTHILSWLPCGTRFKIHNRERFTKEIMPSIGRCTRYKSFLRQLSMYKFHRVTSGPLKGAYHHPHFRRNRIEDCRGVIRGRAPVIKYVDESTNFRPTTKASGTTVMGNQTTRIVKATEENRKAAAVGNHRTICRTTTIQRAVANDGETTTVGYPSPASMDAIQHRLARTTSSFKFALDSTIAPRLYSRPQLTDGGRETSLCPVKSDANTNWTHQEIGQLDDIGLVSSSSSLASLSSSIPAIKLAEETLVDLPTSSLPTGLLLDTSTPLRVDGRAAQDMWHLNRGFMINTEDIIDEIISTFATTSADESTVEESSLFHNHHASARLLF